MNFGKSSLDSVRFVAEIVEQEAYEIPACCEVWWQLLVGYICWRSLVRGGHQRLVYAFSLTVRHGWHV